MRKILIELTDELLTAIDHAKDGKPRAPFMERILWDSPPIIRAANELEIEQPDRPEDGRGGDTRG